MLQDLSAKDCGCTITVPSQFIFMSGNSFLEFSVKSLIFIEIISILILGQFFSNYFYDIDFISIIFAFYTYIR